MSFVDIKLAALILKLDTEGTDVLSSGLGHLTLGKYLTAF